MSEELEGLEVIAEDRVPLAKLRRNARALLMRNHGLAARAKSTARARENAFAARRPEPSLPKFSWDNE